jgi:hypothetical protein
VPNGIRKNASRECSRTSGDGRNLRGVRVSENSTISQKIVLKENVYTATKKIAKQYFPTSVFGLDFFHSSVFPRYLAARRSFKATPHFCR